ncbi:hypothetical protein [Cryobacterium sp. Hb1]|uniref:hypothetical protein n=1 Tax=Cryobacterium sp. Hb1 TaxID=1259147 RepID=UPI00106C79AD|nr:hypothetical protein [Cryobacterium sp. Hb1]TFD70124.1 hypothetical protein E3T38_06770 [Cryobacterium sp. Hb1]
MASFKPLKRASHNKAVCRRWALTALSVFVIGDIALVAVALAPPGEPSTKVADAPAAVISAIPTEGPVETTVPVEPVQIVPAAIETFPPTRILSALDANTAWRTLTGPCPATPAAPERTTDSGASWASFDASIETDASSILTMTVVDETETSLVTLDASDCAPQVVDTYVAGEEWANYPERASARWFVNPSNRALVHTPNGDVAAPCASVAVLATRSSTAAALLCGDGTFLRTTDAGASWGAGIALNGGVNLTSTADGYLVVAQSQASCDGLQVLATGEPTEAPLSIAGCRSAAFNPGDVAVSSGGETLWLWAGDALSRSNDGGATWF